VARAKKGTGRARPRIPPRRVIRLQGQLPLFRAVDSGPGIELPASMFGGSDQGEWGRAFESFRRLNEAALQALGVSLRFESTFRGPVVQAHPGDLAGAIPLRSGASGQVVGGFVVAPRFGWTGIGSVLSHAGWRAAPQILEMPLVPGSGREVPPWVLAGPVVARLEALLASLTRGFDFAEESRTSPRGTILWPRYLRESLPSGRWHQVPCRFPDLSTDPVLKGAIRWTLQRILEELVRVGGTDLVATRLRGDAQRLLDSLQGVVPLYPRQEVLHRVISRDPTLELALRSGLQAIGWVRDERGLGGGRQTDGLAWALPLDRLWEQHVAGHVQARVRTEGGTLFTGDRGQTTVPLRWSSSVHRSLSSLVPDIVVQRQRSVWIVDAKYKAHMAELDDAGWRRMGEEMKERHRADIHQVMAYASLFDKREVTATLAYPLRPDTWRSLRQQGLDRSSADLYDGSRHLRVELWGLPFAGAGDPVLRDEFSE
jgi:hypothetical protein